MPKDVLEVLVANQLLNAYMNIGKRSTGWSTER
jgi:hypothetical protein